jgi:starch synthase
MSLLKPIHVLHVASEVAPFAKSGGLADVAAALPRAQVAYGVVPVVVLPRYRGIDTRTLARRLQPVDVPLGRRRERVVVHEGTLPGGRVRALLIEHPWFDREGGLYGDARGDYPDNGLRFALLARAALEVAHVLDVWPELVHGHDWQAGLLPLYAARSFVAGRPIPKSVFTIHNMAFRGLFDKQLVDELGLGWDVFTPDAVEFYDQISFLKTGMAFADHITTVSPRYAREIQTPEQGYGLDGFLHARAHKLTGILNGIDSEHWDPGHDTSLPVRYDADDPTGKAACKAALQRELGLPVRASVPLIASIARLTDQKGFDLVVQAGEELARSEAQYVFLGTGDARYEQALRELARRHPMRVAARIAHDEEAAHRMLAGADMFLMPSRYEPCGLTQMYALRYGAIPIVRATGGLDDTVVDYDAKTRTGSGFKFDDADAAALGRAVRRAITAYKHKDAWLDLVVRSMRLEFGWSNSARRYVQLYQRLLGLHEGHHLHLHPHAAAS